MRGRRVAPAANAGSVALLPGSRDGELRKHLPVILAAFRLLQQRRPAVRGIAGAANERTEAIMSSWIGRAGAQNITVVRGAAGAIAEADAAWVASGTAVLECALAGVPVVALYIADATLARRVRKTYKGRFVTLPNLVLEQPVVPEFLQERATPEALAQAMDVLLRDPEKQFNRFAELREKLGPPDALERCAAFAVTLAKSAES